MNALNPPSALAATLVAALAVALAAPGCAINPATGRQQLSLISESQEIRLGQEADQDVGRSMGLVDAPALERTVSDIGQELAALSERPGLPWKFEIVDDPAVNAFALPGGFIYVTRGILARFQSEAELAAVLGHEIGHVTARHSVNQISKAQLAGLGLGLGAALDPEIARFSGLAESGLGLLFLKFGRDDERQSDDLGLRYMRRAGYPGDAMVDMFRMLGAASGAGGGSVPGWLSTHPSPENREERILQQLPPDSPASGPSESYLRLLEGLVYGPDPRQGYFSGDTFLHPEMAFRLDFPSGWEKANGRSAVGGRSPQGDAAVRLTLAGAGTPAAAADAFFGQAGVARGGAWRDRIGGLPTVTARFTATGSGGGTIRGLAAFVALGDRVFQILGYATGAAFEGQEATLAAALASFDRVTDRQVLEITPRTLAVTRLDRARSLQDLQRSQPSSIPMDELALLNRVEPGQRLPAGTLVKRVVGGS